MEDCQTPYCNITLRLIGLEIAGNSYKKVGKCQMIDTKWTSVNCSEQ